jgi:hypothetical protein
MQTRRELFPRRERAPLRVGPIERPSPSRPPLVEACAAAPEYEKGVTHVSGLDNF